MNRMNINLYQNNQRGVRILLTSSLLIVTLLFVAFCDHAIAKKSNKKKRKELQLAKAKVVTQFTYPALTQTQKTLLAQIRPDPAPEEIVRNSHYWVSNEHHHELWHSYIKDVQGAYVGVGTDQNYLLAGWSKPQFLILMDFDGKIEELHQIYEFFFSISATPADFLKRWHRSYRQNSIELLTAYFEELHKKRYTNPPLSERKAKRYVKSRVKIYKLIQSLIYRRLKKTMKKYQALKIKTFLDDQAQYTFLRGLWQQGRVLAIRGDLTAEYTMLDIAKILKKLSVPLNVLYLSNAEQYFNLIPTYRRNIIAQNWGEKSYALRTLGWRILGYVEEDEKYHYNVQPGKNFAEWMRIARTNKTGRMLIKAKKDLKPEGFSIVTRAPKASKRGPKIADMPKE